MGRGATPCDRELVLWTSVATREKVALNKILILQALLHCKRIAELPKPIAFLFIGKFLQKGEPTLAESLCWAGTTQRGMCFHSMGNWAGITPDQLSDKSCEKRVAFLGLHLWEQSLMYTEPSRPPPSSAISFHC